MRGLTRFFPALMWSVSILCPVLLKAQNSDAPKNVSNTYFLKNCTLVSQPGVINRGHSVIIRDGLIAETGPGVRQPFDAQVISCDSLYIYAGFIDPYSNTGITKPENKERPKAKDPGNPPSDVAGIMPDLNAATLFNPSDKSVEEMRSAGFGISHTLPHGLMLPGQSSIFLLGDGPADRMLVRTASAQNFQFEVSRGVYPSTIIGVMAKFRDLFKNASQGLAYEEKYKINPAGLPRPDQSRETKALYPVVSKSVPLYFLAQHTKDVHRAFAMKEELGFDMVLAEVRQGWHYADKIKAQNITTLLSLNIPEPEKKDSTAKTTDVSKEKESFEKKREESRQNYLTQASLFEKKGIRFAFSYKNVKTGDIHKNIRTLIKNGLSESYALAALTTHPATILGISSMAGTVEKGKIANLVITDKPIFDEKSRIKHVFVEGKKYDMASQSKKPEVTKEKADPISGTWSYTVETPETPQKGKIIISKSGEIYKVTVKDETNSATDYEGMDVSGKEKNKLSFYINTSLDGNVKVDFSLSFEDKLFTGSVNAGHLGSYEIKGEKVAKPEN